MTTSTFGKSVLMRVAQALLLVVAMLVVRAPAFAQTAPGPDVTKAQVTCEAVSTSTITEPKKYGLKDKDGKDFEAGVPVTFPDLVLFSAYCYISKSDDALKVKSIPANSLIDSIKFPACSDTANVCTVYQKVEGNVVLKEQRVLVAEVLVQNKTNKTVVVARGDIKGHVENKSEFSPVEDFSDGKSPADGKWENLDTPIYPPLEQGKCRVIVSGALDPIPEDVAVPEVRVSNGKLLFTATVMGASGLGSEIVSIDWVGGPDKNGLWENPPLNSTSTVTAKVKVKVGQTMDCSIKVRPVGQNYSIGFSRFGDCAYYGGLRRYYYWDANNQKPQTEKFKEPLRYPGIVAAYGTEKPDVPFRGVINVAASIEGMIEIGNNGDVVQPPVEHRRFSKAVVVARVFNKAKNKIGDNPVAWGVLDPSDYSVSQMALLENVGEDETVVFQAYLAATQRNDQGQDIRGTTDPEAKPFYNMILHSGKDKPYDYLVPFVNSSCGVMSIGAPNRKDKEIGPELGGVKLCTFSKPFVLKDLASGRVKLDIMHITPEYALHQFPPNLLKTLASNEVTCNKQETATRECWEVKAQDLGITGNENPFESHDQCREVKTIMTNTQVCDSYGCRTVSVPTTVEVYKPSCQVTEQSECGPSMAMRFSGYNQMKIAALGCAAKYNRSGEQVTATLLNEGIIPYTTFGGSAPQHYTKYDKNKLYGKEQGYACIPCRFAGDATKAGGDLKEETKALPVDQDQAAARKPIYQFTKGKAPKSCVKDVTFSVRYFGSGACDGVNAPPGHFCSSNNISQQNCSTTDVSMTASNPFAGGGNVAGQFRIPVCPGSGINYDSIAVSWSPIIVDIAGNGISISRSFDLARQFDIRGDGRARVLDWPLNNDEVAFLVRPDKKGNVTSIKELFGDYKAKNGFVSLAKLDSNKDGKIDRKDKAFKELGLWFDRNRNAKVDAGEIEGLEIHGVFELPLTYTNYARKGAEGKTLTSSYFNHKYKRYMNVEDHYFYEYISSGQKMSQK